MVIGLIGKKQVGKDTLAAYLVNKYGFERKAFADKLKELDKWLFEDAYMPSIEAIARKLDRIRLVNSDNQGDLIPDILDNVEYWEMIRSIFDFRNLPRARDEEHGKRRHALQVLGTDILKKYNSTSHINGVTSSFQEGKDYVVSDVRFKDEAAALRDFNAILVKITRIFDKDEPEFDDHISENQISDIPYDVEIINEGHEVFMYTQIDEVIKKFRG